MNDASRRQTIPNSINVPLCRLHSKRQRTSLAPSSNFQSGLSGTDRRFGDGCVENGPVLAGVVACLSGLDIDLKDHLHGIISSMGGKYVRDFDPKYVTHLILDEPKGSKYEYVMKTKQSWAEKIDIVTSSWVEACVRERRRVPEIEHQLQGAGNRDARNVGGCFDSATDKGQVDDKRGLPLEIKHASLEKSIDWMLQRQIPMIFSYQNFLLHGFESGDTDENNGTDAPEDNMAPKISVSEKFSRLIRRAGGSILWNPHESTSIVVINDNCSKQMWDDAKYFCKHHPRGPIAVTPIWVLCSLYHQTFEPSTFPEPPRPRLVISTESSMKFTSTKNHSSSTSTANIVTPSTNPLTSNKTQRSYVFRGDVFAIVHLKPPTRSIDFVPKEMESIITSNGGLLLSDSLFQAIKSDVRSQTRNSKDGVPNLERKFYVITSGGYALDHSNFYPLLAELLKLGVKVVPVTPIWVIACVNENTKFNAEEHPLLFQPQTWPLRLLNQPSGGEEKKFLVSVTGFVESPRYGIIHMLKAIGASYTDNLRAKNTHLICREAQGQKFKKAVEWGLHVVSVEWLYHTIRYGYIDGSEEKFSLIEKGKDKTKSNMKQKESTSANNGSNPLESEGCASGLAQARRRGDIVVPSGKIDDYDNIALEANGSGKQMSWVNESASHNALDEHVKDGNERSKRLQFALESLQTPARTNNNNSKQRIHQRRSIRRLPQSLENHCPSPEPPQHDEDFTQSETQFSIRVDADVGLEFGENYRHEGADGLLSQDEDEENNGESQIVWFPATRG